MSDLKDITCCFVDHGLYLPLASKLAQTYRRVLYFTPWERGFPTINDCCLGDGFGDIERCDDLWKEKAEVDLFVFPDILHAGLQEELREQGFPVWGSGTGQRLEMDRLEFLRTLSETGLPLPTLKEVRGISALREHLREEEDKYIKISKYRGTMETWHWRNWKLDSGTLDVLAVHLGSVRELLRFLVFDAIDSDIEVGGDTYCIDGRFPNHLIEGYEWKDKSAFGAFKSRADLAPALQDILEAFGPVLGSHTYRNYFSMEVRGETFIDPCCRGPMPLTGSQMEMYKNLPEIIYAGAQGELVQPEVEEEFCCECVLTVKVEKEEWANVTVPHALEGWMKLSHCCLADGVHGFPPYECRGEEIGWLVAIGDTPRSTLEKQLEQVKLLPDGVCAGTDSLVNLLKEIQEAEAQGLEFSPHPTPEPAEAIQE